MNDAWLPDLRCPATRSPYDLDSTRTIGNEIVEGFLVSRRRHEVRPILSGIAVLPLDLRSHLRNHGNVYARIPVGDSSVARFVLGHTGRGTNDFVPFDEIVSHYGDLTSPNGAVGPGPMDEGDEALARMLAELAPDGGRGLDVGCGVGRGVFVLCGLLDRALGVDRSASRIRRARNIAVTQADFFLPPPPDAGTKKEIPLELDRLERRGADFAVASADALPLTDACVEVAVLRSGDGRGPWPDPALAVEEACRVVRPGGLLIAHGALGGRDVAGERLGSDNAFTAWRLPR